MSNADRIEIGDRIVFQAHTPHGDYNANRAVVKINGKQNPVVYFMGGNLVIRRADVLRVIKNRSAS